MPTYIDELREKYPELQNYSDTVILKSLHEKYFSNYPLKAFVSTMYSQKPKSTLGEAWSRLVSGAAQAGSVVLSSGLTAAEFAKRMYDYMSEEERDNLPGMLVKATAVLEQPSVYHLLDKLDKIQAKYAPTWTEGQGAEFMSGLEQTAASAISGLPGTVPGMVGGFSGAVLGNIISGNTLFGLSEIYNFKKELYDYTKKQGLSDEQFKTLWDHAFPYAVGSGLAESGLETASDILTGKILGVLGTMGVGALGTSEAVASAIKQLSTKFTSRIRNYALRTLGAIPPQVLGESATSLIQKELREAVGLPDQPDTTTALMQPVGPAAYQTLIMGALAGAANEVRRKYTLHALNKQKERLVEERVADILRTFEEKPTQEKPTQEPPTSASPAETPEERPAPGEIPIRPEITEYPEVPISGGVPGQAVATAPSGEITTEEPSPTVAQPETPPQVSEQPATVEAPVSATPSESEKDKRITQLLRRLQDLKYKDHTLTKVLLNFRGERLATSLAIRRAKELNLPVTFHRADVTGFKEFNDQHGETSGDEALKAIGRAIQDFAEGNAGYKIRALASRPHGDEFGLVSHLNENNAEPAARALEDYVNTRLREEGFFYKDANGQTRALTIDVGHATAKPGESTNPSELVDRAKSVVISLKNQRALQEGRTRRGMAPVVPVQPPAEAPSPTPAPTPAPTAEAVPAPPAVAPPVAEAPSVTPQKAPVSAEAPAGKRVVYGADTEAWTIDNRRVPLKWAVVEAEDLMPSHDIEGRPTPGYPQERQPRDRSKITNKSVTIDRAQNLNPALLAESALVSDGAPIYDPNLVSESGTGRTNAIKYAYEHVPEKAKEYKTYLLQNADKFGIDRPSIRRMEKPVLVRIRHDRSISDEEFAEIANVRSTEGMSAAELAIWDARRLTDEDMAVFNPDEDGYVLADQNKPFIRRFMAKIPKNEQGMYLTDGKYNKQLADRIQNAIFQKAYGDASLTTIVAESANPDIRTLLSAMNRAASRMAKAQPLREKVPDADVISKVLTAVDFIRQARSKGVTLHEWLSQPTMFEAEPDRSAVRIARFLYDNKRSAKRQAALMIDLADAMIKEAEARKTEDMFGLKRPTADDLVNAVMKNYEAPSGEQPALLQAPARVPVFGETRPTGLVAKPTEQPQPEQPQKTPAAALTEDEIKRALAAFDEEAGRQAHGVAAAQTEEVPRKEKPPQAPAGTTQEDIIARLNAIFESEATEPSIEYSTEKGGVPHEFKPEVWEKTRPLLQQLYDQTLADKGTLEDFARLCARRLSAKGRPYFERFIRDLLSGGTANVRVTGEQTPAEPTGAAGIARPEGGAAASQTVQPATGEGRPGEVGERPAVARPVGATEQPVRAPEPEGGAAAPPVPVGTAGRPMVAAERTGEPGGVAAGYPEQTEGVPRPPAAEQPTVEAEPEKPLERVSEESQEEFSGDVWEPYTPVVVAKGSQEHPTRLVESAAMNAVKLPPTDYVPNLPHNLIERGALSDAQYEVVVYTGHAHSKTLPDGKRMGIFIGDGTGVGKGREIAGIILDNWRQGRKKAVWLSMNTKLMEDAQRDLAAVGLEEPPGSPTRNLFLINSHPLGQPITRDSGICFLTYSSLIKENKNKGLSRIEQLVQWLGKDFDGVIIFDESHRMSNALPPLGDVRGAQPSKSATKGVELQNALPKARICYFSATGASEPHHLAYMTRLGLWGEGTAFPDETTFVREIGAGGPATMEFVARDLKAQGKYISRSLDYSDVTYERIEHKLTPHEKDLYNATAQVWRETIGSIDNVIKNHTHTPTSEVNFSYLWSSQLRFYNSFITSLHLPDVIDHAKERLAEGYCPVFQIVTTGEARQKRALSELDNDTEEDLDAIDLSCKDILLKYLKESFPVQQWEEVFDPDKNKYVMTPVFNADGTPKLNPEAVRIRDELIKKAQVLDLPTNPLDVLVSAFGTENVAEVTGRQARIIQDPNDPTKKRLERGRTDRTVKQEVDEFIEGKRRVLIFSEKGGTGASYHTDLDYKNQSKRYHYVVQAGWSATKCIQGFGRTHRSHQAVAPAVFLPHTDIPAHARFISSIAKKLESMGALTKGQRETQRTGLFTARDNLESSYAQRAWEELYDDIRSNAFSNTLLKDGTPLTASRFQEITGINTVGMHNRPSPAKAPPIVKFFNRLLHLDIDDQKMLFDEFSRRLDEILKAEIANGTLDIGLETLRGKRIELSHEETVYKDKETGAETKYVTFDVVNDAPRQTYEQAITSGRAAGGFVFNLASGHIWAKSAPIHGRHGGIEYRLSSPGMTFRYVSETELRNKNMWKVLDEEEAQDLWDKQYNILPSEKTTQYHMITGAILPIWDRLPGKARIFRIRDTKTGQKYLGRLIPPRELEGTLFRLDVQRAPVKLSPQEIYRDILFNNATFELVNRWTIMRSVSAVGLPPGAAPIQVFGPTSSHEDQLRKLGLEVDKQKILPRFYLPDDYDRAIDVLTKLLNRYPVARMTSEEQPTLEASRTRQLPAEAVTAPQPAPETEEVGQPGQEVTRKPMQAGRVRSKIIKLLSDAFDVPIRAGGIRGPKAVRGLYYKYKRMIRTRAWGDIRVVAHEVGHHIQGLLGLPRRMPPEVQAIASPGQSKSREGFAEFLSYYITNPEQAKTLCPNFYITFEEALSKHPDAQDVIIRARQMYLEYKALPPLERALQHIVTTVEHRNRPTMNDIYTNAIDGLYPFKRAKKEIEDILGRPLKPREDIEILAARIAGYGRIADVWLHLNRFQYDPETGIRFTGPSLKKIIRDIDQKGERFYVDAYLVARRIVTNPKQVRAWYEMDPEELENWKKIYEMLDPKYRKIGDELDAYSDDLLRFLVNSGRISEESYRQIKAANAFYVPLYRLIEPELATVKIEGLSKAKIAELFNPVKRMKGSTREIYSPIESLVYNTYVFINIAERQRLAQALVNLEKIDLPPTERPPHQAKGIASIIWKSPKPVEPVKMTFEEALEDWARQNNIAPKDAKKALMDELGVTEDSLQAIVTTFRPTLRLSHNQVILYDKGKPGIYEVRQDLYKALKGLDVQQIGALTKIFSYPAKWVRVGSTITLEFMGRNSFRDQLHSLINSKHGYIPWFDYIHGIFNVIGRTELYQRFCASGAAHSSLVSLDRYYLSNKKLPSIYNSIFSGEDIKNHPLRTFFHTIKNPLEFLQSVSSILDEASRVGYFRLIERLEGKSLDTLLYAGSEARDLVLDFQRKGLKAAAASRVVAFLNAGIRGIEKTYRTFTSKEKIKPLRRFGIDIEMQHRTWAFTTAVLTTTLPSIYLFLSQKDDEAYQEIPTWRRVLFWNFVVRDSRGNLKAILSFPKPFEVGILFGTLPEIVAEWICTHDDKAAKDFMIQTAKAAVPSIYLNAVVPPVEWYFNESLFFGRPLVPRGKEELEPYLQYGPYTSEAIKLLCYGMSKLPVLKGVASPAKMQNLVIGYTGGIGRYVLDAADELLKAIGAVQASAPPARGLEDLPLLRGFLQRMPAAHTRSVEQFYDVLHEEKRAWESKKQRAGLRGWGLHVPRPERLIFLETIETGMRYLHQAATIVTDAKQLDPVEKRERLNQIYRTIIRLARVALEKESITPEQKEAIGMQ